MKFQIPRIAPSDITPQDAFHNRRAILTSLLAAGATSALRTSPALADPQATGGTRLQYTRNAKYSVTEAPNKYEEITSYNNFYEFGTDKEDPKANAGSFKPEPWSVTIDGEAEVKGKFTLEDILKGQALEERIYRFRCVEAWSMVIPWVGFPLSALLARFKPTSKAKYVELTTLYDPRRMPGQRVPILHWPYVEGLRMDEAMHPLTLMVVGLYGQTLPNQDGAPLRLIVPWKYGFKSIKSIVKVNFTERQPRTAWNEATPNEYGFYANVNPKVDHPRWSQATERHIGGGFFNARRPTLPFNGYADLVADLYKGMDLRRYF
jgi:methionine sulfoxide reductase catalytic subunit